MLKLFKRLYHNIIDLLYAKACLYCYSQTFDANNLCLDCAKEISYITEPKCYRCGEPFVVSHYKNFDCISCADQKLFFDSAQALFIYDGVIRELIHRYKFEGKTHLAQFFARLLVSNCKESFLKIDYIIAIPTHPKKIRQRGFCHSTMLAKKLSKQTGIPLLLGCLAKVGEPTSQHKKGREARIKEIKNTFSYNASFDQELFGKSILLIDDVMTSGATSSECARMLRKKARCIRVLTIAKTKLG